MSVPRALCAALLLLGGCAGVTPKENEVAVPPAPHDPNESLVAGDAADGTKPATSALSARTTLLEENEHLRDQLAKALAERRDAEKRLGDSEVQCGDLEKEVTSLRESVARLSEQLDQQASQLVDLEATKAKLEKDRTTLAEMYALEKRQRLAFEKEALEREIRNRTLSKDG